MQGASRGAVSGIAAVVAAIALLAPPAALGATADLDGSVVRVTASSGESNAVFLLSFRPPSSPHYQIEDRAAAIGTGSGCNFEDGHVNCPLGESATIAVALGDGDDLVQVDDLAPSLLAGDGGHDRLIGGDGNDRLEGGPGDDEIRGRGGADDAWGGTGRDIMHDYETRTQGVVVTMDDLPNDGAPGEADNVRSDVEQVFGSLGADRMTAGARATIFTALAGNDSLTGGGGADTLDAGGGDDVLDGAGAEDTLMAGPGADLVIGGNGRDVLLGGADNDVLAARDGQADVVRCGDGHDTAIADRLDAVANDCEAVQAAAPPQLGKSVVAGTVSGRVLVRRPGARQFTRLGRSANVPVGSTFDARHGVVRITSATDTVGGAQSGEFRSGAFRVGQTKRSALTELRLVMGRFTSCGRASAASVRAMRKLWGRAKGRFRTRGRYSAATVRGTVWLVADRCDGTLTQVREGSVEVRDFVRRRTVVVERGQSYLARR